MRIKSAKVQKKCIVRLKWLKIDGCMHPLLKIDGCSCTLCTRYYEGPVGKDRFELLDVFIKLLTGSKYTPLNITRLKEL